MALALLLGAGAASGAVGVAAASASSAPTVTVPQDETQDETQDDSATAPAAPVPAPSPSPAPDDSTSPAPTPPADSTPPVILTPADGALVAEGVTITGTATPGATVQILAGTSSEPLCIVTPGTDGSWSCTATTLGSSSSTPLRAVEIAADGSTTTTAITVRVLNAPVVTGGPHGSLTNAVVQGTAFAGATVTATAAGYTCSGTADASGAWTCPFGDGITDGDYSVTATQSTSWSGGASSPSSAAVGITVDVTVPASPVLASPAAGGAVATSGAVLSGFGEPGATVSVFAGAHVLCQTPVSGSGSWSCTSITVPAGSYTVVALQQDAAGNVSIQSAPLTLVFQNAATTAPGTPTAGPTATGTPGASAAPGVAPGTGSGPDAAAGGETGSPDAAVPGDQGTPDQPAAPGTGDGAAPTQPAPGDAASGTWSDSTRFTAALNPALGSASASLWWVALLAGLLALLLIALPTRLLAGALGTIRSWGADAADARPGASAHGVASVGAGSPAGVGVVTGARLVAFGDRFLGRNRSLAAEYDQAPDVTVGPVARGAVALLASAVLVMLSAPVESQPAYLRLFLATAAALALVTVVATVLPSLVARVTFGVGSRVRVRPSFLLVTAVLALVSRLAGLEPALVFGLAATLVLAPTARGAARATLAALQLGGLLVVGVAAWLVSGALQPGGDAVGSALGSATLTALPGDPLLAALVEFVHVLALASLGSAAVLLLPFGASAGRALLDRSPLGWGALALATYSVLAMLFVPSAAARMAEGGTGAVLLPLLAGAFAAVSVSVWAWTRFVATDD
ncbi:Ig-like domain-containing protein [Herbiconiux sp. P18]|uniref:Ig-like domain-containing protein n=1 Tax=Herbiconiux liangxiaofengii TaxID=3342795 RepID=UPI0035B8E6B1